MDSSGNTVNKFYKHTYDDPLFRGVKVPFPFWQTLPEVEQFQGHEADVVINSFPKCGTSLMAVIVHMIQNDANPECLSGDKPMDDIVEYLEQWLPGAKTGSRPIDRLNAQEPPRTYFTHIPINALPKSITEKSKIVYVARNPKDAMVSFYHFCRSIIPLDFKGTLEDFVGDFIKDDVAYGPFFEHLAQGWENRDKPNAFFVTFEELVQDQKNVVSKLAKFLGKSFSEAQLDSVVENCRFDNMKKNKNTNRSVQTTRGTMDFKVSSFLRSGVVGNWKRQISVKLNEDIDAWIAKEESRLSERLNGLTLEHE